MPAPTPLKAEEGPRLVALVLAVWWAKGTTLDAMDVTNVATTFLRFLGREVTEG